MPLKYFACLIGLWQEWPGIATAHVLMVCDAAVDLGLVEAVGVCNYKIPQLQQFHSLMLARDIPIASNQVGVPPV